MNAPVFKGCFMFVFLKIFLFKGFGQADIQMAPGALI